MKKFIIFFTFYLFFAFSSLSDENNIKILYKVNENVITNIDIINEVKYLKTLNKNFQNIENNQAIKFAENSLVREIIKKDEIEKFYEVNYNTDSINPFINQIFVNLGFNDQIEFESYISKIGITIKDIKKKLIIEKTWNQLIYEKYKNKIKIDNDKISKELDEVIKKNTFQKSFNLSEIVFAEKSKEKFKKKYEEILKSIKEIGFPNAATIHSVSDTSKTGGKIGWVKKNQLSKVIYEQIKNLKNNEFTKPINTAGGSIILLVNESKDVLTQEINKEEEISKMIKMERDRQLNEFSVIYYKKIESKSYVQKF